MNELYSPIGDDAHDGESFLSAPMFLAAFSVLIVPLGVAALLYSFLPF